MRATKPIVACLKAIAACFTPTMAFFDLNVAILKVSGLWVPEIGAHWLRKLATLLFNTVCVFYSMVFFTVAELMSLGESSKDRTHLVENLNMSLSFLLTLSKLSVWFGSRGKIVKIMTTLVSTANTFEEVAGFDPKLIVEQERKVKDRLTYTFFALALTVPSSACLLTFYDVATKDTNQFRLPYHSYVPFNYDISKGSYCAAVVYQCLALLSCGTITVGFDMLFTALVGFTSAHFVLLQGAFRSIRGRCLKRLHLPEDYEGQRLNDEMDEELNRCIRHLQLILSICEDLEGIFNVLLLLQMLVSLIVFCTCLYIISSMENVADLFGQQTAYMLAIENQLALYCYSGNKLTLRVMLCVIALNLKGEGIPFALYEGDWYTASKKFKRNMILTTMRMQKPIYLTAAKFTALNLATFVTIGRGSYSLLAVLKNRQ